MFDPTVESGMDKIMLTTRFDQNQGPMNGSLGIDLGADAGARLMPPPKPHTELKPPLAGDFPAAMRIPAEVKVVIGSTIMTFAEITKLGPGAVIALNRRVTDPLDITINGLVIARGHGCVTDENADPRFGVILTEVGGRTQTP